MDWQNFASQLVALLLPQRTFAPGEFETTDKQVLLAECATAAATDARAENALLRAQLDALDAVFAAEQRLLALGANPADIDLLRNN